MDNHLLKTVRDNNKDIDLQVKIFFIEDISVLSIFLEDIYTPKLKQK